MSRCDQELCENWSGDGNVCPCAILGMSRPSVDQRQCPDSGLTVGSCKATDLCDCFDFEAVPDGDSK